MPIQKNVYTAVGTQYAVDQCSCGIQTTFGKHLEFGKKFWPKHDLITQQSLNDIVGIFLLE